MQRNVCAYWYTLICMHWYHIEHTKGKPDICKFFIFHISWKSS